MKNPKLKLGSVQGALPPRSFANAQDDMVKTLTSNSSPTSDDLRYRSSEKTRASRHTTVSYDTLVHTHSTLGSCMLTREILRSRLGGTQDDTPCQVITLILKGTSYGCTTWRHNPPSSLLSKGLRPLRSVRILVGDLPSGQIKNLLVRRLYSTAHRLMLTVAEISS